MSRRREERRPARARPRAARTAGAPVEPPPAPAWLLPGALVGALALYFAHAWLFRDFVIDDAFVTLRYARNLASGAGLVFNPGQRVEGFSNPLLTLLLAPLWRLAPHAESFPQVARAIGVLAGAAAVALLARVPARGGAWTAALAMLLCAASTSWALWSVAGLETALYGALVVAALLAVPGAASPARQWGAGALLAAVALSRPDGVLPAAALFAARFADARVRGGWGGHLRVFVAAAAPVALGLAYRRATYGEWVPNTYFAKFIPAPLAHELGGRYLAGYFATNGGPWLFVPALASLAWARRGAARTAWGVLALTLAGVWWVGGDWMNAHRFVAPVVPLVGFVVAEGWVALLSRARVALAGRAGGSLAAATVPAGLAIALGLALVANLGLTRAERAEHVVNAEPYYATMGRLVARVAEPGWTVAADDIGAIGWYGGTRVLDLLGLTEPALSRRHLAYEQLLIAQRPEIVILHYDDRTPPRGRWRLPRIWRFDSLYAAPGDPDLPGSFRVRADVAPRVAERLAALPPADRAALVRLARYLRAHQPDGRWRVPQGEP